MSHQLFNFQRFDIVMEYEEKPILPVPFTMFSHVHLLGKYIYRSCKGLNTSFESGLKLVLDKFDMERLYDFEEEGVEAYLRHRDEESQQNMESKVKSLVEMSEELRTKLSDLERWEKISQESSSGLDFRLQRLEEIAEQTSTQLSVIHRFMAATANVDLDQDKSDSESGGEEDEEGNQLEEGKEFKEDFGRRSPKEVEEAEKAMQDILERSSKVDPKLDKAEKPKVSKQDTIESEPAEFVDEAHRVEEVAVEEAPAAAAAAAATTTSTGLKAGDTTEEDKSHGSPGKKKISFAKRSASRRKQRHISSGGSSTAADPNPVRPQPPSLRKRRNRNRARNTTESSEDADNAFKAMLGLHGQKTLSEDSPAAFGKLEGTNSDEEEDEEVVVEDKSSVGLYRRAQSEATSSSLRAHSRLPRMMSVDTAGVMASTASGGGTATVSNDETDSTTGTTGHMDPAFLQMLKQRRLSSRALRRIASTTRDYTSITDDLEMMMQPSVAAAVASSRTTPPPQPPSIKIEVDTLHDAEETDYNLLESLIERRLRRDSHNLQASLEELITKSIQDTSSTTTGPSNDELAKEAADKRAKKKKTKKAKDSKENTPVAGEKVAKSEEAEGAAVSIEVPVTRAVHGAQLAPGGVRVRLAEDADRVEVEFIDERRPATHC